MQTLLQADQDADVEPSHNVQDDSALPMEEDTLPDAACPVISSDQVQLSPDHVDLVLAAEAASTAGRKRKQQDSSMHQLPRCVVGMYLSLAADSHRILCKLYTASGCCQSHTCCGTCRCDCQHMTVRPQPLLFTGPEGSPTKGKPNS